MQATDVLSPADAPPPRLRSARPPPPGRLRHSDRGSQYAALACRDRPAAAGPGWTRRGNPCDDATAESLVKTLKVEGVRPTDFETFEPVAAQLPRVLEK